MINTAQLTPGQRNQLAQQLLQARRAGSGIASPSAASTQPHLLTLPALSGVHSPYLQCEAQPLDALIRTGHLPPVQAAALAYWPDAWLSDRGLPGKVLIQKKFGARPVVASLLLTPLGRVAVILVPRLQSELYTDGTLLEALGETLTMAAAIGAQSVSLTGLLPSATGYGTHLAQALCGRSDRPRLTTGHAMTATAVVLNINHLVTLAGRTLATERVAFLGLGSIGLTTLRLLLQVAPHPRRLLLCDLASKLAQLQTAVSTMVEEVGFQGEIQMVPVYQEIPAAFYDASLIVGATNVPDVLDVARLQPGTLLVDDSGPPCFNLPAAITRLGEQGDLLFTEGGAVQLPASIQQMVYTPPDLETLFTHGDVLHPRLIMGCVLSSLLCTGGTSLPPTVGPVEPAVALAYYQGATALGIQAAPLHCADYHLPATAVPRFRQVTSCTSL